MHNLKQKILLATVLVLPLYVTFAEPVSDRITVTVRGKGPDVLLIPGLTCSTAVWDATAKRLEGHYRLHLVQVAGFASAPPRECKRTCHPANGQRPRCLY
jgi:pimeloyl-ACP methyl ester carboxylesterase